MFKKITRLLFGKPKRARSSSIKDEPMPRADFAYTQCQFPLDDGSFCCKEIKPTHRRTAPYCDHHKEQAKPKKVIRV